MTTVLCVPGSMSFGNIGTLQTALGGPQSLLTQLGDNTSAAVVPVTYNDWDTFNGYKDGANKIDAALHHADSTQNIVVFGHSFGAVSACQWLRQYGPGSSISPSRLRFVLIGNSIRPGGGSIPSGLAAQWGLYLPVGPVSSRYQVYDIAVQFDKWADSPNVNSSQYYGQAMNNTSVGDGYPDSLHVNGYNAIRLGQGNYVQNVVGQVTSLLFETNPVPLAGSWWGTATRAQIETAYNRAVSPPTW